MPGYVYGPKYPEYLHIHPDKCTDSNHQCVHDWRIEWGNVERGGDEFA